MKGKLSIFHWILIGLILIGLLLVGKGTVEKISLNQRTRDYESVVGYFSDQEVYREGRVGSKHHRRTTYRLIYTYYVNGTEYRVKTDYGTEVIPALGTEKEIKFNPHNPAEAIITGTNGPNIQIVVGLFFILIPSVFLCAFLAGDGVFDKLKINVVDIVVGIVFLVLGLGMVHIIAGGFHLLELFMLAGPFALIPVMFVVVSVIMIKRGIFGQKKVKKK